MRNNGAACFGASVTVAAMVTAGFSWFPVLMGWCAGAAIFALLTLLPEDRSPMGRLGAAITLLGGVWVMTAVLLGADGAFPAETTFPFVSVALLLVLWRAMCGRPGGMEGAANCLGLLLLAVLGTLVLFGLGEVRWSEAAPVGFSWRQLWVSMAAVCPWWSWGRGDRRSWLWLCAGGLVSVGLSLLTHGALGAALAERETAPLYRAVQCIRILGAARRLEALFAAAVLLGAFGSLLLIGRRMMEAAETLWTANRRWIGAGLLLAVFLAECAARRFGWEEGPGVQAVFWGLLPIFALWLVVSAKFRKKT